MQIPKKKYNDFFCGYVIRAALIISCLFHDIGYPVAYYMSIKNRLIDFIPSVYSIMGDNNFDFNYIYSILSESVLFQFVDKDDICRRFNKNDHGTISAIMVGIFFYKTGMIHSLPVEKQVAVELGMLAIYNHTLDLKICDPTKDTQYIKMQFSLNPISYILRWCDDMQEWEREYFEIAPVSSLLYCSKCRFPLRRERMLPGDYLSKNGISLNENILKEINENPERYNEFFSYKCLCCGKEKYKFTKRDNFTRRKLLQIKACDSVVVERNDSIGDNSNILIDFKYNLYKLLRLSNINPQFIAKRQEGINSLKAFLFNQQFLVEEKGYRYILIKHNLYANPIFLKALIIKNFLETVKNCKSEEMFDKRVDNILKEIKNLYEEISMNISKSETRYSNYKVNIRELALCILKLFYTERSKKYAIILKNCIKYISLSIYQDIYNTHNEKNVFKPLCNSLKRSFSVCKRNATIKHLINNAFDIIEKSLNLGKPQEILPKSLIQIINDQGEKKANIDDTYFRYPSDNEYLFSVIADYCDTQSDLNDINQNTKLTYYTDLYLYEQLSYLTELMEHNFSCSNKSDANKLLKEFVTNGSVK